MPIVFISYKRENGDFVKELEERLEREEILSWRDTQIEVGEEWIKRIDLEIDESFALILVMTPEALKSPYVNYEWSYALGGHKPIIPIELKPLDNFVHPRLRQINWLSVTDTRFWEKLIDKLQNAQKSYESKTPAIVSNAIELLNSPNEEERSRGISILASYDYPDQNPAVIKALGEAVNHGLFDVKMKSALALAKQSHHQDDRAIPPICEYLLMAWNITDGDILTRLHRLRGGRKGPLSINESNARPRQSISKLVELLEQYRVAEVIRDVFGSLLYNQRSTDDLQELVANALSDIGDSKSLQTLQTVLSRLPKTPELQRRRDFITDAIGRLQVKVGSENAV